jgi:hypothetical protein
LFLGLLRGVPFHWTFSLLPQWALTVGVLLLVFNIFDQYIFVKEDVETPGALAEDVQPKRRGTEDRGLDQFSVPGRDRGGRGVERAFPVAGWDSTSADARHGGADLVHDAEGDPQGKSPPLPLRLLKSRHRFSAFRHDDSGARDPQRAGGRTEPAGALAVKSIAEQSGIKMPSWGYMIYSFSILTPIFVLLTFAFF